jgi:hypothetical protein
LERIGDHSEGLVWKNCRELENGRAGIKKNRASFDHALQGGAGYARFGGGILSHSLAHRKLSAAHIQSQSPAVGAHELPICFQTLEITAHGFFGDAEFGGDLNGSHAAPGVEAFDQFTMSFESKHWFFLCLVHFLFDKQ